ncbi:putative K domain-containing protein [Medicago truncatula]|nr:far upstream element-binding protein 2 [Medicago truncatula]AES59290.2 RNA-binding KH domain protein [Medicago truncatula]RHN77159.1 putative K domain-containing protein [Medicago truncatula]
MADESQYDSTPPSLKRKYDEQPPPHSRTTGFSDGPPPPSYNNVPPPATADFELIKQRAQQVAARLLSGAAAPSDVVKRTKFDNGPPSPYDSSDLKSQYAAPMSIPSYSHQGSSKKIEIPNGRVGVIIGKGGETIKYLQLQSGAKIQVTRDMDADPNSPNRLVELTGTSDAIATAEKLIKEVLAEAESGGNGLVTRRMTGQGGADEFSMKIPNNKVGLIIGKGGETIKSMQATTGARIQVIPLHLPPGDTSTERTLKIEGTSEQIESAKQLVDSILSGENRLRNPSMSGGYSQQGYQARPPSSWAPPAASQQPGYGYAQPGAYPGPTPQYNVPQQAYAGYPPHSAGGYSTNWDQSTATTQQSTYDYYNQQPQQPQNPGGPAPPADGTAYNYSQPPSAGYNQPGQGYSQDGYGAYQQPPQSGYAQPTSYDQQQGYGSAQEGQTTTNYGSQGQGDATQVPPVQPSQQGYGSSQQPSPNAAKYPPQGAAQPSYGVPPTSQTAYGSQPQTQSGYGPPQTQKPSGTPPAYGQSQSPNAAGGYGQPGYPPSQPPPSGYSQPGYPPSQPPPSGYSQPGYGQAPQSYNSGSYGAGYPQAPAYSADGNASGNARGGSYDGAPAQGAQQASVAKSPQS